VSVPPAPPAVQFAPPVPDRGPQLRLLGAALVVPAFALLLWSYVWPTIWDVWNSFRRVTFFVGEGDLDRGVGSANYDAAFRGGFWGSVGFALTLAVVPLLVVFIAAPALAWAAHRSGTAARWVVRVALALPLAAYAPAAIALGSVLDTREAGRHPTDIPNVVRATGWAGTFGLACAVAVTAYLAALRRRDPRRPVWPALLVVGGLLTLAVLALALQSFTYPYLVAGGGPRGTTNTPLLLLYQDNFIRASLGSGAAVSTLLLIPLMLLGTAAAVLIIVSRLRIEVDPKWRSADESTAWPPARVVAVVVAAVLALIVFVGTVSALWPWLHRLGDTTPRHVSAGQAVVNSWLPTLISTAVGVGVALLAAFGIGALRPLGRRSELLLLPFAPWLFVGTGPLLATAFTRMSSGRQLGTFLGLIPPTWVAIPVLFIATLLFRGQEARLRAAPVRDSGAVARNLVLPVLPMVPILFGAVWLWQSQDLLWQLGASNPEKPTAAVAAVAGASGITDPSTTGIGLVLPVALLVLFLLAAVAAQVAYLDRVAVRVGRDDPVDHGLPTPTDLGYGQSR